MARFISLVSLAPDIGKTTIALNLGLALHNMDKRVVVFDADFSKPNILEHLNIDYLPITLDSVFNGDDVIYDTIYRHSSGLKIIPSLSMHDYSRLSVHLHGLHVDYDYVIIDTPLDILNLPAVLNISDEAIIVHNPFHSSKAVLDVKLMLKKQKVTNLGIIMNMAHPDSVESMYELPVIAKIPNNKHIRKSFELKNPLLHVYPKSTASKTFRMLAEKLVV